jgi:CRISPR-associated protein Csm4
MSCWKLVRLKFGRNVAHFGELGIGIEETSERIRSDTLLSAWISAYARLASHTSNFGELLEQFNDPDTNPPFRLSSTFIYQRIGQHTRYYLPRPRKVPPNYSLENDLSLAKDYKKLEYLPLEVWHRWYQTDAGFSLDDVQALTHRNTRDRYKDAFKMDKIPKIAVDRITRATNLYHTGVVQYNWSPDADEPQGIESLSGLYFLVKFSDTKLLNIFFDVLDFLSGEGIGGERSSGAGQFKVDHSSHELTPDWENAIQCADANAHSLMSLFWTDDSAHLNNLLSATPQASYELQERGGWIASPCSDGRQMRRQAVQMFTEGSVFPSQPLGKLADVTPDGFEQSFRGHKVYRSGIALSLPVKVKE